MLLSDLSIRRPVLATMMTMAFVVFGLVAYNRMGIDLFPDVDFPIVTATTRLEGADPETVETTVTEIVEEAVNTISGIKTLRSVSTEGVSQVMIEFELEEDLDVKAQEVRDKISAARADLPSDIDPPLIEKMDLDAAPIMTVVISGEGLPIRALTDYADDVVKERLQRISGVGAIALLGGREREIRIWVDPARLEARLLTVRDVVDALREQNVEIPGGRIETGPREFVVKTEAKVKTFEEFGNIVLVHREGADIPLSDVARVEDGMEDERSLALLNGKRAIAMQVRRQSGTNMVAIADRVRAEVAQLREELPPGMEMAIATDNAQFVRESINEVQTHLWMGGLLAIAVVFLFLRNLRSTVVVAIVIPTAVIGAVAFVWTSGFTFNNLTLLALTLAVGILIDDAIVMVENIYRHVEAGEPPLRAALLGAREITFAVLASSLSLLSVFVPVAFMTGMVGQFFFEFGMTMAYVIVISTFIALSLTPMLCSRLLKRKEKHNVLFRALERVFRALETTYARQLRWALSHPFVVLLFAVAVFVGSVSLAGLIPKEFIPQADESEFQVTVETPAGSSLDYTRRVLGSLEDVVRGYPGVRDTLTSVGGGAQEKVNVGSIQVVMVPASQRNFSQMDLMSAVRQRLAGMPGVQVFISEVQRVSGGGMRDSEIQFNFRGPSLTKLQEYADSLADALKAEPGFVDVDTTYETGKPEVRLYIDRRKASDMGVKIEDLALVTRDLVGGIEATRFEEGGEQYDVRVRALNVFRDKPESLASLLVRGADGSLVRFGNLTQIEIGAGPTQIDRQARQRQVTVLANLDGSKKLGEATTTINKKIAAMNLPSDYTSDFTGMAEIMAESFQSIQFSLLLAVILVYMVLAAQFEAYSHPFTVMLTVPLAMGGAFVGLFLTQRTLSIFSMIGLIVLVGIVTKNAILLIDYTNQLRREQGMARRDALLQACPVRMRPILMTAFSTIAGSLPVVLGFGVGSETRAPMATAIVFGLLLSTLLTLFVVPVVYTLLDRMVSYFGFHTGAEAVVAQEA